LGLEFADPVAGDIDDRPGAVGRWQDLRGKPRYAHRRVGLERCGQRQHTLAGRGEGGAPGQPGVAVARGDRQTAIAPSALASAAP